MYMPYVAAYAVPLAAGTIGLRHWKKKRTAAGNGMGTAYPAVHYLFILAAVFCGLGTFLLAGMTYADYRIFTEKRSAEVTDRMGITPGDDVTFRRYFRGFGGPDGSNTRLTLTCTGDVRDLLDAHCRGTLTKFSQDGNIWGANQDPDDPDETPYGTLDALNGGEISEYYEYIYRDKRFSVLVYPEAHGSRAVIF